MPVIFVDSVEEVRIADSVKDVAAEEAREVIEWSVTGYFSRNSNVTRKMSLEAMLDTLLQDKKIGENKILLIKDIQFYFNSPEVIGRIKQLAQRIEAQEIMNCTVIIIAPLMEMPKELATYITIMEPEPLSEIDIRHVIEEICKNNDVKIPEEHLLNRLAVNLKGLSERDVSNIIYYIISGRGAIKEADMSVVLDTKKQLIKKSGILELITVKEDLNDIGGLENLKEWLTNKQKIFRDKETACRYGVAVPKGVLIAGMPGCGKSLTAKAVAATFEVPLLRLDMGRLMGKYVGESEGNMRRALQLAEATAPCVLWIDELEKAFAGVGSGGSEVTTRLFGNFLTWMQEKDDCMAFVVATANNIVNLPPELLRKGRFDEIFYVGLPNPTEREKIFRIHLKKTKGDRKDNLEEIDVKKLVAATKGYCGADIEGVVKDGVERAFIANKEKLETDDIIAAINNTHSLSETMEGELDKMAKSYKEKKFKNASK